MITIKTDIHKELSGIIEREAPRFTGKLLLRNEIPLPESTFQQLLNTNILQKLPSIHIKRFINQCVRCGNTKKSLFGKIPCASCEKVHLYCRKCIEMGRIMECESLYYWPNLQQIWPIHESPC